MGKGRTSGFCLLFLFVFLQKGGGPELLLLLGGRLGRGPFGAHRPAGDRLGFVLWALGGVCVGGQLADPLAEVLFNCLFVLFPVDLHCLRLGLVSCGSISRPLAAARLLPALKRDRKEC